MTYEDALPPEFTLRIGLQSLKNSELQEILGDDLILGECLVGSIESESGTSSDEQAIPVFVPDLVLALGIHLFDRFGSPRVKAAIKKLADWIRRNPPASIEVESGDATRTLTTEELVELLCQLGLLERDDVERLTATPEEPDDG